MQQVKFNSNVMTSICLLALYRTANPKMPAAATLPPVPDLDGRRWCCHCSATLPLASFPAGRRRYICHKHVWQYITKPSKTRCLQDRSKKRLWLLWKRCWTDARLTFGQTHVGIVQGDIDALLQDLELELDAGVEPDHRLDQILILPVEYIHIYI